MKGERKFLDNVNVYVGFTRPMELFLFTVFLLFVLYIIGTMITRLASTFQLTKYWTVKALFCPDLKKILLVLRVNLMYEKQIQALF